MTIIAIDPGLTGGFAVLRNTGEYVSVDPLPIIRDGALAWIDGSELRTMIFAAKDATPTCCVLERVSAMPKQGVSSSFNFGVGFGSLLGAFQVLGCPLWLVQAAKWKRELGLSRDKNASLDKARLLFPNAPLARKKDDGLAEALLIAHWFVTKSGRET
jgi:crossover junction endodeoxyribonuclease RuvC